jgi:hypothetical protein
MRGEQEKKRARAGSLRKPTQALHDGGISADRQKTPLIGVVAGVGSEPDPPGFPWGMEWVEIDLKIATCNDFWQGSMKQAILQQ